MDFPFDYVPPATGISTPTREEIVKGGFLTPRLLKFFRPFVHLDVLAAPAEMLVEGGRWALPAGELLYATEGLAFITQGKRIGRAEQYLGGTLFNVLKNVGMKFVEPLVGGVVGEAFVSKISGTHELFERLDSLNKYKEGFEHSESLFLPINRVVSLSLSFEPRNMYGIRQLDLVVEDDSKTFTPYAFLAREEDGDIFREQIPFIYFLRLSYEQRLFQTMLFRRYVDEFFEVPEKAGDWSMSTLSFRSDFYERAATALNAGAPSVAAIRMEALTKSRDVISRLQITKNQQYNLDTPSGKLFDLTMT
ncbi:hypothetical protein [Mesorhizobium loti]|uniref:hypothetical protein n=1 Tax=Rhizobium loti TaxID=381 RepID=UPI00047A36BD|nr:hypothetical protein [Mesorhizobium loti]